MVSTTNESYILAHSAECQLSMIEDSPDRSLRFVLGQAFQLDEMQFRVAEIEGLMNNNKHSVNTINQPQVSKIIIGPKDIFSHTIDPSTYFNNNTSDGVRSSNPGMTKPRGQSGSLAGGRVSFDDGDPSDEERRSRRRSSPNSKTHPAVSLPPMYIPGTRVEVASAVAVNQTEVVEIDEVDDADDEQRIESAVAVTQGQANDSHIYSQDTHHLGISQNNIRKDNRPNARRHGALTRTANSAHAAPELVSSNPDNGESDSDSDEADTGPESPPSLPSDLDVHTIIASPPDEELGDLFELVRCCPCHDRNTEKSKAMWYVTMANQGMPSVDDKSGMGKKRLAVLRVDK